MAIKHVKTVKPITLSAATLNAVTFDRYSAMLTCIASGKTLTTAGLFDDLKGKVSEGVKTVFGQVKGLVDTIKKQTSLGVSEIVAALQQKNIFDLLKAFKFNLKSMLHALQEASTLLHRGLVGVFKQLESTGVMQKLRKGLITVDELLEQHPILKKVTGVALAGLLLYLLIFESYFTGNPETDLSVGTVMAAFSGHFSLDDLFGTPSGLAMLSLIALGFLKAPSIVGWASWTGSNLGNLALALIYSGARLLKDSALVKKIKPMVKSSLVAHKENLRATALIAATFSEESYRVFHGKKKDPDPKRHADQAKIEQLKEKIMKLAEKIKVTKPEQQEPLRQQSDRMKAQVNRLWSKWARSKRNPPYTLSKEKP